MSEETSNRNSKRCGKKIRIGAKLTIEEIIKASYKYLKERCTHKKGANCFALQGGDNTYLKVGYRSALQGGDHSILQGGSESAIQGGDFSASIGWNNCALQGGDCSSLQAEDDSALKGGYRSAIQARDYSVCYGDCDSVVRGGIGSVLAVLYVDNDGNTKVAHGVVGQDLKPNTWYGVVDGKLTEVE